MEATAYERSVRSARTRSGSAVRRLGAAFTVGRGGGRIPCRPTSQMMRNRAEHGSRIHTANEQWSGRGC